MNDIIHIKDGWKLNPNQKVVDSILKRLEICEGECPCSNPGETLADRICPCKEYRDNDHCCCTLYVKDEKKTFGELKEGDLFYEYNMGSVTTYVVDNIKLEKEFNVIVITSHEKSDIDNIDEFHFDANSDVEHFDASGYFSNAESFLEYLQHSIEHARDIVSNMEKRYNDIKILLNK